MIGSCHPIAADRRCDPRALADCWWGQIRLLGWGDSGADGSRVEVANGLGTVLAHPGRGRSVRGRTLEWVGPGERRAWELPVVVAARGVAGDAVWATLEGAPIVARRQLRGLPAIVCGLDPADVPAAPELGAILRLALLASRPAAAWLDLDGIVALRMDDPGASASVHLDPWNYEKLDPEDMGGDRAPARPERCGADDRLHPRLG